MQLSKSIFAAVIFAAVGAVQGAPAKDSSNVVCVTFHTVVQGDTCFDLGNEFGTTAAAIIAANPQVNAGCTNLVIGEVLCIP